MLWKAAQPLRLAQWVQVTKAGELVTRVEVREYACTGGTLRLTLVAPTAERIELARNDRRFRVLRLAAGQRWVGAVPALPRRRQCKVEIVPEQGVTAEKIEFVRSHL